MTVGAGISVQDGSLLALGAEVLREVRPNVLVTPAAGGGLTNGAFLGVRSAPAGSRSVFPVGKLRYVIKSRGRSSALCLSSVSAFAFGDDSDSPPMLMLIIPDTTLVRVCAELCIIISFILYHI
jgi:hypothetical protein